jgi:hypothetical protein
MIEHAQRSLSTRPIAFPSDKILFFVMDHHYHPNTNLTIIGQQWRAVNPMVTTLITKAIHPLDSCSDTSTSHHGP